MREVLALQVPELACLLVRAEPSGRLQGLQDRPDSSPYLQHSCHGLHLL